MHSPTLVISILVCLCWFTLPEVNAQLVDLTDTEKLEIEDVFNEERVDVSPNAADMLRVYYSDVLEGIARAHVQNCMNEPNVGRHTASRKFRVVGETIGLSLSRDITSLIEFWFAQGGSYDYDNRRCNPYGEFDTCDDYLEVAWNGTCQVGCAIAACHYLSLDDFSSYLNYIGVNSDEVSGTRYLVVCNYGPGNPDNTLPPYTDGSSCSACPAEYPLCYEVKEPDDVGGDEYDDEMRGLCHNSRELCIGSDPHFAIRLAGGQLLCYTFQGVHNTTFNLISNKHLEMNALFVPDDTNWDNTWLGAIGIIVIHEGKRISTLEFVAVDQLIRIGGKIQVPANAIRKLIYHNGRLTIQEVPFNHTPPKYPRVHVELIDHELNFTIGFAKNSHLDLYWHSPGVPYEDSDGVIGQFFRRGVTLDVHTQLLHVPGRRLPVPLQRRDLWKFMEQSFHSDTKCWGAAYHSSQGAGIVEGTYKDYIVDDLLAVRH